MAFYPLYVDLEGKECIVIGGGAVAERKVGSLLDCGAIVKVISPEVTQGLSERAGKGHIEVINRPYVKGDLDNAILAFVATSDQECNKAAYREAIEKNIPVNVVDSPEYCTFIVPSTIRRGDLVISISTSGSCPALARSIREELEREFGDEYAKFCELLRDVRGKLADIYEEPDKRVAALNRIIESDAIDLIRHGQDDEAKEHITSCI